MTLKREKWLLLVLSIIFFAVIFVWMARQYTGTENNIFLQISYGELKQDIRCWQDEDDGILYFFLPAAAQEVRWSFSKLLDLRLDGVKVEDGSECVFESGRSYILTADGGFLGGKEEKRLVILQSENLASVYLTTDTGKMDYILEKKGNEEGGTACLITAEGQEDYTGAFEELKGRGNYTWLLDKKSLSLSFKQPVRLLDLAEDSDWVLMASACEDTHLINRMAFEMMRSAGISDVPNSTWIDLYLNGEYAGICFPRR